MSSSSDDSQEYLRRIYAIYKFDTKQVVEWLASNGKAAGCSLSGNNPSSGSEGQRYLIRISDFMKLANCIKKRKIQVPRAFQTTLDRAIALRKEYTNAVREETPDGDESSSTEGHDHFVKTLQDVRETLRPLMPQDSAEPETPSPSQQDLSNRFTGLEIQYPSQRFLSGKTPQRPTKIRSDNATYEADMPLSRQDLLMEFSVLVSSMNDLRAYVQSIWSRYAQKTVDLGAAALATNTAHELVENMISDFQKKVKVQVDFQQLTSDYFKMCCKTAGTGGGNAVSLENGHPTWDEDLYRAAEKSYFFVYSCVSTFTVSAAMRNASDKEQEQAASQALIRLEKNLSQETGFEKARKDFYSLHDSFNGLFSTMKGGTRPIRDEAHNRAARAMKNGPSFDLAFAGQVFLDISHTIRDQAGRPFQELKRQLEMFDLGLKSFLTTHKNLQTSIDKKKHFDSVVTIHSEVETVRNSAFQDADFRASPVLIGLLLLYFRTLYYQVGVSAANGWRYVHFCTQIANAMRITGHLKKSWLDLVSAQELLGMSGFFLGGKAPRNAQEVEKSFVIDCGYSATTFAKGGKRPTRDPQPSKNGMRQIPINAEIHAQFLELLQNRKRLPLRADELERVVQTNRNVPVDRVNKDILTLISSLENKRAQSSQDITPSSGNKRSGKSGSKFQISPGTCPERTIERLLQAIEYEAATIKFPYLDLHVRSLAMLFDMAEYCAVEFPEHNSEFYAKGDCFGIFTGELLEATFGLGGTSRNTGLIKLAAQAVTDHVLSGQTVIAFKTLKILEGGDEAEIFNLDLEESEGTEPKGVSFEEGSFARHGLGANKVIVIRNGKWYTERTKKKGSS